MGWFSKKEKGIPGPLSALWEGLTSDLEETMSHLYDYHKDLHKAYEKGWITRKEYEKALRELKDES